MAAQLENVLVRLLVPDNATIQQATSELREVIKDPAVVPALCTIISTSQNPQVRQIAAVLLRRRIMKKSQWRALPDDIVNNIKANILQVLLQEQEHIVRKSLAELIGTIGKHDLMENNWPQLLEFIQQYSISQNVQQREIGVYILSTVSKAAPESIPLKDALMLCSNTLQERENVEIAFQSVMILRNLVSLIGTDCIKLFQQLVPKIMAVIKGFIQIDEEKACETMEVLDELIESEMSIIVPFVANIVEFCLEIGADKSKGDPLRIKALSFVSWLTRLKKKTVLKLKLVDPILNVIFPVMCEDIEDVDDDDIDAEANAAPLFASQVIDVLALHLPPDKFIPSLMKFVEPGLQDKNANVRRASFTAIAVTCEGCADHLKSKYLKVLLQCVYNGLNDESMQVRNAALFALGHFSEHLQPQISKFSADILPLLFASMAKAEAAAEKDPKGLINSYFALEMFCENLENDIIPYLPTLMDHLLKTLQNESSNTKAKELALSVIGATANAAGEQMLPYFQQIIGQLKEFLVPNKTMEDRGEKGKLQIQAIDTLGVLARTIGVSNFLPLASECLQLGLNLLKDTTDPDLRRCIYGLLSALSVVLKADLAPFLPDMVNQMIESLTSTEGITTSLPKEDFDLFRVFDEDIENADDDDDDNSEGDEVLELENAYIEEKEDACNALGELATNTGSAFLPFIEDVYKELMAMIGYPSSDVRRAAVSALGQLCSVISNIANETQSGQSYSAAQIMLKKTYPEFLCMVREDTERRVAMEALMSIEKVLKEAEGSLLLNSIPDLVNQTLTCVKDVFIHKMACQGEDSDNDMDLEEEEAEYDSMLLECAGDVIPGVAKVVGGQNFIPYFQEFLPDLLRKVKPANSTADKSFAIGTIGEILHAMGPASSGFSLKLYPHFVNMLADEDEEVRSNAVFGIGVLTANAGQLMYHKYGEVLKVLFSLVNSEKDKRVTDNIVAAVCRLIVANKEAVPLDQVMPVILQFLPLKEDFEENVTVYPCIAELYMANNPLVIQNLPQILNIFAATLGSKDLQNDVRLVISQMVQNISQQYPDSLQTVATNLDIESVQRLKSCIDATNGS